MSNDKEEVFVPEVIKVSPIVEPVINVDEAVKKWQAFQDLKGKLLEERDYIFYVKYKEEWKGKKYQKQKAFEKKKEAEEFAKKKKGAVVPAVKKSGWRKLATPFNLSDDIVKEVPIKDNGRIKGWRLTVKITAPNGRTSIGVGACTEDERRFAHTEHDTYATAHTRAKNRAISDMIAGGEVSAEEIQAMDYTEETKLRDEPDNSANVTPEQIDELKKLAIEIGYEKLELKKYEKDPQAYINTMQVFKKMKELIAQVKALRDERVVEVDFLKQYSISSWDELHRVTPKRLGEMIKELEGRPLDNTIEKAELKQQTKQEKIQLIKDKIKELEFKLDSPEVTRMLQPHGAFNIKQLDSLSNAKLDKILREEFALS